MNPHSQRISSLSYAVTLTLFIELIEVQAGALPSLSRRCAADIEQKWLRSACYAHQREVFYRAPAERLCYAQRTRHDP